MPLVADLLGLGLNPKEIEQGVRLELEPMGPVGDPPAFTFDILPRCDRCCRPDHGDQVSVATDFDAQHAKARLFTVKGHPLDGTSEMFRRMGTG